MNGRKLSQWVLVCLCVILSATAQGAPLEKLIGKPAPDFSLTDLQGQKVQLSQWRGKGVVIVFFAFWCDTWKEAARKLRAVRDAFPSSFVQLLGIAVDPSWKEIGIRAQQRQLFPCPIAVDKGGQVSRRYGITKVPTILLIDRQGVVRLGFIGTPSVQTLKAAIIQLQTEPQN